MSGVADTSIDAYRAHTARDLSEGQRRVMRVVDLNMPDGFTRAEISAFSGMPLQSVCGRVNELIAAKVLEHGPRRNCSITGNGANPVRLPVKQLELV